MGLGSKRLLKLSVFCVIIIIAWLGVKTLFHPDFGGLLSDTGHETEPKENWNAIFLPQVGGIMENKSDKYKNTFNENITKRGMWQQPQLEEYCSRYGKAGKVRWNYLLYEDNHKFVYCTVPKIACTTMKTMMALLQGLYTMDVFNSTIVTHAKYLNNVRSMCISGGGACDKPKAEYKYWLNNYYKFMIVRDPLERIVSAYYNRLTTIINHPHDLVMQKRILQYYNDSNSQYPSFSQFVGFFIYSRKSLDKHFFSMIEICDPCRIQYDFYANFKILNQDVDSLIQLLNIPREYYFNNFKHEETLMPRSIHYNSSLVIDHFNQLSSDQRMRLFKELAEELEFYESIYPGELEIYKSTFSEFQQSAIINGTSSHKG